MKSTTTFQTDDEVLVRFRLYSDPYAHGWGWAIDNFRIQGNLTGIKDELFSSSEFNIYPNPTNGDFTVRLNSGKNISQLKVTLVNILGKIVWSNNFDNLNDNSLINIQTGGLSSGIYLIRLSDGNYETVSRISIQK